VRKFLFVLLGIFFLGCMTVNAAPVDPVNMLRSIANQLINSLKAHKTNLKNNPSLVYSIATRIVVPHADLAEMSKRVIPPSVWQQATNGQRSEFQGEFTTLLVRTYASALAEYNDQTIQFFPVRGGYAGKNNVKVDSQIIRSDGPSISVSYKLILKGSEWKLYDLSVEGVSLIESFRSQFADKLSRGNMAGLIANLKQHNAENSGR
jgi:phospholipid transport system substrate-binding protein